MLSMLRWVCSLIDHRGGHRAVGTAVTHTPAPSVLVLLFLPHYDFVCDLIAKLAKRSPIIIQNSSNPSGRKNLDVRPYDRTTVQGATFNIRGHLYRGQANTTALFSSPVVSALGSESDDSVSSPGRGKVLCP